MKRTVVRGEGDAEKGNTNGLGEEDAPPSVEDDGNKSTAMKNTPDGSVEKDRNADGDVDEKT